MTQGKESAFCCVTQAWRRTRSHSHRRLPLPPRRERNNSIGTSLSAILLRLSGLDLVGAWSWLSTAFESWNVPFLGSDHCFAPSLSGGYPSKAFRIRHQITEVQRASVASRRNRFLKLTTMLVRLFGENAFRFVTPINPCIDAKHVVSQWSSTWWVAASTKKHCIVKSSWSAS